RASARHDALCLRLDDEGRDADPRAHRSLRWLAHGGDVAATQGRDAADHRHDGRFDDGVEHERERREHESAAAAAPAWRRRARAGRPGRILIMSDIAMHDHPVIGITGVKKIYRMGSNEVAALRGVDLRVERGEMIAIMGASGSGKSTLM